MQEIPSQQDTTQSSTGEQSNEAFWFPGRWIGGISLIVAPLLLLAGAMLRIRFHFFFPQQLKAFEQHPTLMVTAYSLFLAGNMLLWPAIITLTQLIGIKKPGWALWGGTMVIFGLFARTFHAGIDHMAFQLVRIQQLKPATQTVAASYGAFHIVSTLSAFIMFGWIVLAIGAFRSNTLGLFRAIALASMSALMMGVLKGSSFVSIGAISGLCIAFVPLGLQLVWQKPRPTPQAFLACTLVTVVLVALLYFWGQLG